MVQISVGHLYPDLLNLYGDRGNVISFVQRCRWRGIPVKVKEINLGDRIKFEEFDFLFLGGGSDREQGLMAADLGARVDELRSAVDDGLVVLAICGGYQMMGQFYRTSEGNDIPGLGIMSFYTEAGSRRLIGNVAVEAELAGVKTILVGFENHGGKTHLNGTEPLGRVLSGHGNNGLDGLEGARYKNVFCSYLHGPLLPKNPTLADRLIYLSLNRRGLERELVPLDDEIEKNANGAMVKRLLS